MNLKKSIGHFLYPDAERVIMVFILEFLLTLSLLTFGKAGGFWVYLISPSTLYLESFVDLILSNSIQLALHGAISNVIALTYLYFLSCLIITLCRKGRVK